MKTNRGLVMETRELVMGNIYFLTLIIYFWIRVVGTSSRIQNKNEISINLFPVCYQSPSIILFCSRIVKSHTP